MTNEQKRMLRVVAAYNDITEEQAEKAIVEDFLNWLLKDDSNPLSNMALKVEKHTIKELEHTADILLGNKPYPAPRPLPDFDPAIETPEQPKVRKKPGRKPKTLKEFVDGTAREVRQAEKMSKDEFVEYFGGKG